jgi:hypothetical protein
VRALRVVDGGAGKRGALPDAPDRHEMHAAERDADRLKAGRHDPMAQPNTSVKGNLTIILSYTTIRLSLAK